MRITLLVLLGILMSFNLKAEVVLPAIFGDHMVLQRNAFIALWGRAEPGEKISFSAGWDEMNLSIFADTRGRWRIEIPTPKAGGPYEIRIEGNNLIVLKDILIGEVWLASGQSNMEWPLSRSKFGPEILKTVNEPQIRVFQVEKALASSPRFDCKGNWALADPSSLENFSSVAYHFAKELQTELGVPIGIIHSSWGGTPAEAWMSRGQLEEVANFKPYLDKYDEAVRTFRTNSQAPNPTYYRNPTCIYNAMIAPIIPFEIRGVIWYQGESNRYDPQLYADLFPALIQNWRKDWQRNMPFFFVQLAPFNYVEPMVGAGLREAQLQTAQNVPKTGMVVSNDVGNPDDIHPTDKRTIGHRLALYAMAQTYGKDILASGPTFEGSVREGAKLTINFQDNGSPLKLQSEQYFEIAGSDQVFHPAKVKKTGNYSLQLWSDAVNEPLAARYSFSNGAEASLFNEGALPASAFRTDDWPMFYGPAELEINYIGSAKRYLVKLRYPASQQHSLHYTLDGSVPSSGSPLYTKAISIDAGQTLMVKAFQGKIPSPYLLKQVFATHLGMNGLIVSQNAGSKEYAASGEYALVDGLKGTLNYQDGKWRGYTAEALELSLDLGKRVSIDSISIQFLVNQGAWIFGPSEIQIETSNNGRTYKSVLAQSPDSEKAQIKPHILPIVLSLDGQKARYIRVIAKPLDQLPADHPGAGQAAWMFVDELIVK
ncbi:MAG: sialate O-acetylesterase [Bacteroidia bacterium]